MSAPSLTTVFTPSPPCNSVSYFYDNEFFAIGGSLPTSDCFPSGWSPGTTKYFSPGICPVGYAVACSSTTGSGATAETIATCCPNDYGCHVNHNLFVWFTDRICASLFPSGVTLTVDSIANGQNKQITTAVNSPGGFNAYGIQIRWKSTDIKVLDLLYSATSIGSSESLAVTTSLSSTIQATATPASSALMQLTSPPNYPSLAISKGFTVSETATPLPISSVTPDSSGFITTSGATSISRETENLYGLRTSATERTPRALGTSQPLLSTPMGLSESAKVFLGVSIPLVSALILALFIFRRSYRRRQATAASTSPTASYTRDRRRPGEPFELHGESFPSEMEGHCVFPAELPDQ